jgi:hypothetical protein
VFYGEPSFNQAYVGEGRPDGVVVLQPPEPVPHLPIHDVALGLTFCAPLTAETPAQRVDSSAFMATKKYFVIRVFYGE